VVDPADYGKILSVIKAHQGSTSLDLRFQLARKAFDHTAVYDRTIADFLVSKEINDVKNCYELEKKE
jgi:phosphoribosylaminoimidazolecarboxamide formyltransferase/IMP cyclohydrolase